MTARPLVQFVVPYDQPLIDRLALADPDALVRQGDEVVPLLSGGGPAAWCYLTYARLRDRGWGPIRLANRADPAAINVAHADTLNTAGDYARVFYVDARADHSHRLFAQYTLVQNRDQLGRDAAWIHHWPQPGLIARQTPITQVRQIGYIGQTGNNNLAMTAADWNALFGDQGYHFAAPASDAWHDLSQFDALIAVRSFDASPHSKKPASKLLNAWRAGVPLVAGADSAYAQIGTPGEDYLLATSPAEVLAALDRLRDAAFREALVERGRAKAAQYSEDAIAALWIEALEGPIAARFARWQRRPATERLRAHVLKLADEALVSGKALVRQLTGLGPRTS